MKILIKFLLVTIISMSFGPMLISANKSANENNNFVSDKEQILYNANSGLSDNSANDVVQTKDGYIWVATFSGLLRFDGQNFLTITSEVDEDFKSKSIRVLYVAENDIMYIGSNDSGLYTYKDGDFIKIKDALDTCNYTMRGIVEDNNGQIYVATTNGIGKVLDDTLVFLENENITNYFFDSIGFDESNKLWGIDAENNILVFENDEYIDSINLINQEKALYAHSVSNIGEGNVLIGTSTNHIVELKCDGKIVVEQIYDTDSIEDITSFYKDNKGNKWVTSNNGVGYFTPSMEFEAVDGLIIKSSIENMIKDKEGNFWFSSSREGVLLLAQSPFTDEMFASNQKSVSVNTTKLWNDILYIGTENGVIAQYKGDIIDNEISDYFSKARVRNFFVDSENNLWVSTYSSNMGVVKINEEFEMTSFKTSDGLTSDKVRSVMQRSNGEIWVATSYGVNVIQDDKIIKTYTEKNGLTNPFVLSMSESHNDTMYIGSDGGGIYEIDGDKIDNYNTINGLNNGVILRINQDPHSDLAFIANAENTLSIIENGNIRNLEGFQTHGNIFDILFYDDLMIILSARGLYLTTVDKIIADGSDFEFHDITVNNISQITANSWNDIGSNGKLYIACDSTVVSIDLKNPFVNDIPVSSVITLLEIDEKKYYKDLDKIIIPPSSERITIHFANLTYINNDGSTVKMQMNGLSDKVYTTNLKDQTSISYTNIKPGNYTFSLSGNNSNNVPTIPNEMVKVSKLSYWYQTYLARSILIIGGIITLTYIIFSYYNLRIKSEIKKKEEYRVITNQAITAIANTIDAKDKYTNGHSLRVANYAKKIGERLEYTPDQLEKLYYTALLHDIGKLGIPDAILKKRTKLTNEEYQIIKDHPIMGANILKDITVIEDIDVGAKFHHERYDGTGYPSKLSGEDIPLVARIICIADAFDAMTSGRLYNHDLSLDLVIKEMKMCSGKQFDPKLLEIFLDVLEKNEIELK